VKNGENERNREKERERERKREKEREKGRRRKTGTLMEKAVEFNRERETTYGESQEVNCTELSPWSQ
jgi:hypothetical protein